MRARLRVTRDLQSRRRGLPQRSQLRRRRIESLIRLAAPALDLVLYAGDRVSRVVGRNEIGARAACGARASAGRRATRVSDGDGQDAETKQLAWEARHRPRAAIAALVGAVGLLVFYVAPADAAPRHAERERPRGARARGPARRRSATCRRCRSRSSSTWTARPRCVLRDRRSAASSASSASAGRSASSASPRARAMPHAAPVHDLPADRRRRRARRRRADVADRPACRSSTTSSTARARSRRRPTPSNGLILFAQLLLPLGTLALAVGMRARRR